MNKDIVPENFTMGLALFDAVPVILFGVATFLLWQNIGGLFLLLGALVCFVSGMLKVLWKIIVVLRHKKVTAPPLQFSNAAAREAAYLLAALVIDIIPVLCRLDV